MTEELDFDWVLTRLLEYGVDPITLARALDVDIEYVNNLPCERARYSAPEEEMTARTTQLATLAFEEARKILTEAPPTVKMRFILSIITPWVRASSNETPRELEEAREEFRNMMDQMRTGAAH